jgi:glycosyltransferase involved in cell wall biosynthesis
MALKVCQLCAVDFTIKHFLTPLIDGMVKEGWHVTSICLDGNYVKDLRLKGYRIITTKISRNYNFFSHLISVYRLYKIFKEEQFDVLHVHTPVAALIGRLAGRLAGISVIIYTAHGFYFHDEMGKAKRYFFVFLEKLASRFHDLLFVQSSEDAKLAKIFNLANKNRILEIGNGVNLHVFRPLTAQEYSYSKAQLKIPKEAKVVGVVGRLVKEKGYLEFFSAIQSIYHKIPDFHVVIVGSFSAEERGQAVTEELMQLKKLMGDRLHFLGYRDDVRIILGTIDIFCLPSHREGLPRSIIEAMAMGIPVIATNVRGCRELVVPGVTGMLVPSKDSKSLAQAICKLIYDKQALRDYGKSSVLLANEKYNEHFVVNMQINKIKLLLKK